MCCTVFFEIPYTNKLWIRFVDFHFCIFSCKSSIEKEYSYIIWKCFFLWEARNGEIILTSEPEIIIVTYIYIPWAPQHICCDVYICPMGFKGLTTLLKIYGSSHRRCSVKKVFLKISQTSQESTLVGVFF